MPERFKVGAVKVFQREHRLRTIGGLSVRDITEDVNEAVQRERDLGRHRLRLLAAHDVLRPRQRVRDRLPRGLRRAPAAARPERDVLRARRLGPAHREHLPGGHGLRQRPLPLHGDAARHRRASRSRCATASSASARGSACSSSSSTASATGAGSSRSSATSDHLIYGDPPFEGRAHSSPDESRRGAAARRPGL